MCKVDIQERRRNNRWYHIASTSTYASVKEAFEAWLKRGSKDPDRYRAVEYGTQESRDGRDPKGYAA